MNDYTPSEETVEAAWSEFLYLQSHGMKHVDDSKAEFDRFMAKVKADALREAAARMRHWADQDTWGAGFMETALVENKVEIALNMYADRIERGEGQ